MASCSVERVKSHQFGVKVVTEAEAIILYCVLSKGSNGNAQKMWEITYKERYELPVGFDLPLTRVFLYLASSVLVFTHVPTLECLNSQYQPHPSVKSKEIITFPGRERDGKMLLFWV